MAFIISSEDETWTGSEATDERLQEAAGRTIRTRQGFDGDRVAVSAVPNGGNLFQCTAKIHG